MRSEDIIKILSEDKKLRAEVVRGLNRKEVDLFEGLNNDDLGELLLDTLNKKNLYVNFLEYKTIVKRKADYIIRGVAYLDLMTFSRLELELATYYSGKDNPGNLSSREIMLRDIKEELKRRGHKT